VRGAEKLHASIYEMEHGMNLAYVPWDGGYGYWQVKTIKTF